MVQLAEGELRAVGALRDHLEADRDFHARLAERAAAFDVVWHDLEVAVARLSGAVSVLVGARGAKNGNGNRNGGVS